MQYNLNLLYIILNLEPKHPLRYYICLTANHTVSYKGIFLNSSLTIVCFLQIVGQLFKQHNRSVFDTGLGNRSFMNIALIGANRMERVIWKDK